LGWYRIINRINFKVMIRFFTLFLFSFLWAIFFVGASKLYINYNMYTINQISSSDHFFNFIALISFGAILISETKNICEKWQK